jgi:hypothetical protein
MILGRAANYRRSPLFDYLVGACHQRCGHRNAHRISSLEVDHQLKLRRLLDRDIGDLAATEEFDDLSGHYF